MSEGRPIKNGISLRLHLTRADNKKTTAGHISSSMRSMAKRKLEFMGTECLLECHYMSVVWIRIQNFLARRDPSL